MVGEITPRRAAVMAYTANLLLRTLPAIEHETNPADDGRRIIIDIPRPDRDDPPPNDSQCTTQRRVPMAWAVPVVNRDPEKTSSSQTIRAADLTGTVASDSVK